MSEERLYEVIGNILPGVLTKMNAWRQFAVLGYTVEDLQSEVYLRLLSRKAHIKFDPAKMPTDRDVAHKEHTFIQAITPMPLLDIMRTGQYKSAHAQVHLEDGVEQLYVQPSDVLKPITTIASIGDIVVENGRYKVVNPTKYMAAKAYDLGHVQWFEFVESILNQDALSVLAKRCQLSVTAVHRRMALLKEYLRIQGVEVVW